MPGNNLLLKVKLIALVVFIFASAGAWVYTALYEMPRQKCEAKGAWWSNKYRVCRAPIYLPAITGRKAGEPRQITWPSDEVARASNAKPAATAQAKPVASEGASPKT